jgi:hypothetical protein
MKPGQKQNTPAAVDATAAVGAESVVETEAAIVAGGAAGEAVTSAGNVLCSFRGR